MNFQNRVAGENLSRLKLFVGEPENQQPMAVEINVAFNGAFEHGHLPAL